MEPPCRCDRLVEPHTETEVTGLAWGPLAFYTPGGGALAVRRAPGLDVVAAARALCPGGNICLGRLPSLQVLSHEGRWVRDDGCKGDCFT